MLAISSNNKDFEEILKEQGVKGIKINMTRQITPVKDLIALYYLIKLFRKEKPFIVHTHTPKAWTLGMFASWLTRVPIRLHTVAGLPLLEATGVWRKLLDFVEKVTYATATKIYSNSFGLKDIILQNRYCPESKVQVIWEGNSNGIDTQYFSREFVSPYF